MIDGTYQANVETPIGVKQGTLTLQEQDGVLAGTLHVLGGDTAIQNGRLEAMPLLSPVRSRCHFWVLCLSPSRASMQMAQFPE